MALAGRLESDFEDVRILFVGTSQGLESRLVPEAGYELATVEARGLERKVSLANLGATWSFVSGGARARRIVRSFEPDVVVGMGGYVSAPVVFAAAAGRIPVVIHEQNAIPGLANRLFARFARVVAVSFPETEVYFERYQTIVTGNPVRAEVLAYGPERPYAEFDLDPDRKTLLVFGGSRGARKINQTMIEAYPYLSSLDGLQVLHVTGMIDFDYVGGELASVRQPADRLIYRTYPYLDHIAQAYRVADLVVARAGATTVAEITAVGLPGILAPYPHATNQHQERNARLLERKGAVRVILDDVLSGEVLCGFLSELLADERVLSEMARRSLEAGRPDGARLLADVVMTVGERTHESTQAGPPRPGNDRRRER